MSINFKEFESAEGSQAWLARKLVQQFNGNQLHWTIAGLDGTVGGGFGRRYNWRNRGFVPRVRNIIKPIIDKSANLFDKPAKYEILPMGDATAPPVIDARFNQLLMQADWQEYSKQLDSFTRLLQSSCTFQDKIYPSRPTSDGIYVFDESTDFWVPILLHVGNAVVKMNPTRTDILECAYLTNGTPGDKSGWMYRYCCPTFFEDRFVKDDKETSLGQQPNDDGLVPASMNYDTKKPSTGVWCRVPEDLPSFQDFFNTHLTDLEFALASQKEAPLVIKDGFIHRGQDEPITYSKPIENIVTPAMGFRIGSEKEQDIGGIGSILNLRSAKNGDKQVSADYITPNVDLASQDDLVRKLLQDLAQDWCVRVKTEGRGAVASGFALTVLEIDGLELREQRGLAFQASLRRMYEITKVLYPELTDGDLQVIFTPPALPVHKAEELNMWVIRIDNHLASILDYLEAEEDLTEEEAIKRAEEIKAANELYGVPPPPVLMPGQSGNPASTPPASSKPLNPQNKSQKVTKKL